MKNKSIAINILSANEQKINHFYISLSLIKKEKKK